MTVLALLVCWFQWQTLSKLGAVMPPGRFRSLTDLLSTARDHGVLFNATDGLLAMTIVLLACGIVGVEWRCGGLTRFLHETLASDRATLALLAVISVVLARCYFVPGEPAWSGDGPAHLAYARFAAASLAQGEAPIWTNFAGAGTPYLQFYGVLFPWLVGLVQLLVGDPWLAIKLLLGGAHVISGLGVYRFVCRAQRSRAAGLVAGLAYVASCWHLQQVLIMGRLPLSLVYVLLPWPFWAVEGLRFRHRRTSAVLVGGVSLGALILTHPGYGFWATASVAGYAGLRLGQWRLQADLRGRLVAAALLLLLGITLSAYLTVGMWFERGATGLHAGLSLTAVPDPDWRQLLVWSNYLIPLIPDLLPSADWHAGYLGITVVVLAGIAVASWGKVRNAPAGGPLLAMSLGALGFLLLALAYRSPLLQQVPLVTGLNASRYLLFATFFLSALAGSGVRTLAATRLGRRSVAVVVIALVVDLGSTTFIHLYTPSSRVHDLLSGDALDALATNRGDLPAGQIPDYRLFTSTGVVHDRMAMAAAHLRGLPTFQSYHPGASRSATSFSRPFESYLNRALEGLEHPAEIGTREDAGLIYAGLAMLNVGYVLVEREREYFFNRKALAHTPILVSTHAGSAALTAPEGSTERMLAVIEQTGVDLQRSSCRRILLTDGIDREAAGPATARVLAHRVWPQRVELTVATGGACFARLAYSYMPQLQVSVDGERVEAWPTAGHFIALPLEPGVHEIVLQPHVSPLRNKLLLVGVLALLAAALAVVIDRVGGCPRHLTSCARNARHRGTR